MSFKNIFYSLLAIFITVCIITAVFIIAYGLNDDIHPADVGVILGNYVNQNGSPSKRLAARLNKGIALYQEGFIKTIIVSGGINKRRIGEGTAMKNYLVLHHIPAPNIIVDNHGSNTWYTAVNTQRIMQQNHWHSVIAISNYYHLARTVFALRRCGISPVYHAHADYFELRDFYSVPREVLAVGYYAVFHHP